MKGNILVGKRKPVKIKTDLRKSLQTLPTSPLSSDLKSPSVETHLFMELNKKIERVGLPPPSPLKHFGKPLLNRCGKPLVSKKNNKFTPLFRRSNRNSRSHFSKYSKTRSQEPSSLQSPCYKRSAKNQPSYDLRSIEFEPL